MTDATPAQALGEASGKAYEFSHDLIVVPLHVAQQYFAGLEAAKLRLQRVVDELSHPWTDEDGTVWIPPTAWAYAQACKARSNWQARAEAAEARVREAEGLLIKCRDPLYCITLELGGEQGRLADELNFDIAAFLAAKTIDATLQRDRQP